MLVILFTPVAKVLLLSDDVQMIARFQVLPVNPFVCLFACLPACPSACLSVCLYFKNCIFILCFNFPLNNCTLCTPFLFHGMYII